MNSQQIKLIGSLYMSLGRMSENIDRIEHLLTASKPQPPRPAAPRSTSPAFRQQAPAKVLAGMVEA